jgi:ribosomal protein S18 acetylase RimI-like enzyme
MSVQVEALAEEVFDAAAAQARAGASIRRYPFGEAVWNPTYPDLYFLNGINDLMAPHWQVEDFERALQEAIPGIAAFLLASRDPKTISSLGVSLTGAGYAHEVRVAMIRAFGEASFPSEAFSPSRLAGEARGGGFRIRRVNDSDTWSAFEASIRRDAREYDWSEAMADQLVALFRWRGEHTPTHYYLAADDLGTVAHVGLFQHGQIAYLHALYTRPTARRRGAGTALTLAMQRESAALGCHRLTLQCIDDGYLPGYYGRLGFRAVGEQHIWTRR